MNPVIQMMNKSNNLFQQINNMRSLFGGPEGLYNNLINTNSKFRGFVNSNKGKSPEQICKDYGIDPNMLNDFMK